MAENTDFNRGADVGGKGTWAPLKTCMMLMGIFLVEAFAVTGLFVFLSPDSASASDKKAVAAAMAEKDVEIPVVKDKFANSLSGRTYLYDTEVVISSRNKHKEDVKKLLGEREAHIRADIAEIFRAAEPVHLHETTLATIRRQIQSRLNHHLGNSDENESYILEVIIPKCTKYRVDI